MGLRLALTIATAAALAFLMLAFSAASRAAGRHRAAHSPGYVEAKIEYCKDCHGLSGQGYRGFSPIPRLAGQTAEYVENQLRAFAEGRRDRDFFLDMGRVHGLSPALRTAVAAHFRSLDPRPFGRAPKRLAGTGQTIYDDGVPEANIPACAACHGPDAEGQDAIPRLAGQLYPYLIKELANWGKERGRTNDETLAVMGPIAHNLTKSQIEAIAAYLSHLE
jgi:cytochrome c553